MRRKWIRMLYLVFAWLFPAAILVQVLLVGLSLFTTQTYWSLHIELGHWIGVLPLLMVILAYPGRFPSSIKWPTWLVFVLCLIQTEVFAMIRAAVPILAAFHPVLALFLFALAVMIARQATAVGRAEVHTPLLSQHLPPLEEKRSLTPN